jgi:hypothetical protein
MSSRLVRGIAVTLGASALVSAAFTRGATLPSAPTLQSGTSTARMINPITFGLIPSNTPKPKQPQTRITPKSTTTSTRAR